MSEECVTSKGEWSLVNDKPVTREGQKMVTKRRKKEKIVRVERHEAHGRLQRTVTHPYPQICLFLLLVSIDQLVLRIMALNHRDAPSCHRRRPSRISIVRYISTSFPTYCLTICFSFYTQLVYPNLETPPGALS